MKTFILIWLIAFSFTACSKDKCHGCEAVTRTYKDGVLQSERTSHVACGTKPTTDRIVSGGRTYVVNTSINCE